LIPWQPKEIYKGCFLILSLHSPKLQLDDHSPWKQTNGLMQYPLSPHHIPILRRIHSAATSVNTWQHALYNHGLWLPRHCGMSVYQEIHEFLQHYNALAYVCLTIHHFTSYSMNSKYHMLAHTKHELGLLLDLPNVQWVPNPVLFSFVLGGDEWGCN